MNENDNIKKNDGEIEIDLKRLINAVLSKAWLISLVAVFCAAVSFAYTLFMVTPLYQSSAMFYVNNTDISVGSAKLSLNAADISASRGLVDTYIVILNTRETMLDVVDYADVDLSYSQIMGMVSAEAVDETEVFRVTVTSSDPEQAEEIANAIAYILPKRISSIVEGSSAKVVDAAVVPSAPSSPNYTKNTILGFLLGCVAMAGIVVVRELMNIAIRSEEDIAQSCKYPVLASVPDMESQIKGGYYYGYGYGKSAKGGRRRGLVADEVGFAAAEAYKLLRTKLQFSFADEASCRVIGVSSAMTGEGKTLSAVNLAYALSQLGVKVLLIDGDMRRPSLPEKLPINKTPGLSDFLTGQCQSNELIQPCGIEDEEKAFLTIAAGRIPPNPMELLSSAKMEKMLEALKEKFDFIILDLPPVGEVSDALAVSKLTDGILLVVRQNYCDRIALSDAVRQFEFMDAKILGMVFNCTTEEGGRYSNKYYKRYYKKYGYHYAAATKKAHKKAKKSGADE